MERRPFGNTGMEVSVLGFGTAWIGDPGVSSASVAELFDEAIAAGMNVVDTAPVYLGSEEKLGPIVRERRDDLLLFSKCGEAAGLIGEDWTADVIRGTVDRSLTRLGTNHLDLLTIHSCDLATLKRGEVIEATERAKAEGKTRFIAYSGDNEALAWAVESGRFDAVMASLNVADQANHAILARARSLGLGIVAKRPIANAAWGRIPDADDYGRTYWERLQELAYPELDLETALGWTLAGPVDTAIVGLTSPRQWREDAAMLAHGPLPGDRVTAISDRWNEVAPPEWIGLT